MRFRATDDPLTVLRYQDAMAIVRTFGKPDLFVTMTCNPTWPEIAAALLPGQTGPSGPGRQSSS